MTRCPSRCSQTPVRSALIRYSKTSRVQRWDFLWLVSRRLNPRSPSSRGGFMDTTSRKELRLLRAYALTATVVLTVVVLAAFSRLGRKTRFQGIVRERIYLPRQRGPRRLRLFNNARPPTPGGGRSNCPRGGCERG